MTADLIFKITKLVNLNIGTNEAIVLVAAIEVAQYRWQEADTLKYGVWVRDILLSKAPK